MYNMIFYSLMYCCIETQIDLIKFVVVKARNKIVISFSSEITITNLSVKEKNIFYLINYSERSKQHILKQVVICR